PDVHRPVEQQEAGALDQGGIEANPGNVGLKNHWTPEFLAAGGDIERVQPLYGFALFAGGRHYVQGSGAGVDHRSAGDTDLGLHRIAMLTLRGNRSDAFGGIDKADVPQRRRDLAVGVKRINAVVLGRDKYRVERAA